MFHFYVLSFFKQGDTIQGRILFKGGHYLRKYGMYVVLSKPMYVEIWAASSEKVGFGGGLPTKFDIKVI